MQPLPRIVAYLSIIAAVFGALNVTEVLHLVGEKVASIITILSTVFAALSRALVDNDGDGWPG